MASQGLFLVELAKSAAPRGPREVPLACGGWTWLQQALPPLLAHLGAAPVSLGPLASALWPASWQSVPCSVC